MILRPLSRAAADYIAGFGLFSICRYRDGGFGVTRDPQGAADAPIDIGTGRSLGTALRAICRKSRFETEPSGWGGRIRTPICHFEGYP
jgi:hypothetical protein